MNRGLEQFVRDHREEFDSAEPGKKVWENIRKEMNQEKKKAAPVIGLRRTWWSAAAAVLLILGGVIWYTAGTRSNRNSLASTGGSSSSGTASRPGDSLHQGQATADAGSQAGTNQRQPDQGTTSDSSTQPAGGSRDGQPDNRDKSSQLADAGRKDKGQDGETGSLFKEEMYHYAKLVEIKHKELKTIEKDEPLLYRQFAGDVGKLDSVYHSLEAQLLKNPNKEQLLEAMVQNLQLQMGLLNHQLEIVRQINHTKKTEYEKAYKTI